MSGVNNNFILSEFIMKKKTKIFNNYFSFIFILLFVCLLTSCSSKNNNAVYKGTIYQHSKTVTVAFSPDQLTENCLVFAHLLVTVPAETNGKQIFDIITREAMMRGADAILIGQGRASEEDAALEINYYGPTREYLFRDQWSGWKYGFEVWEKQGKWIGIGYEEWNNPTRQFHHSIMLQVAFLRCNKNN